MDEKRLRCIMRLVSSVVGRLNKMWLIPVWWLTKTTVETTVATLDVGSCVSCKWTHVDGFFTCRRRTLCFQAHILFSMKKPFLTKAAFTFPHLNFF